MSNAIDTEKQFIAMVDVLIGPNKKSTYCLFYNFYIKLQSSRNYYLSRQCTSNTNNAERTTAYSKCN